MCYGLPSVVFLLIFFCLAACPNSLPSVPTFLALFISPFVSTTRTNEDSFQGPLYSMSQWWKENRWTQPWQSSQIGSLSPRRVLQSWHGMTTDGWTRPPYVPRWHPRRGASDDEDPFGHGDAVDAEEESGASTRRPRNEHESLEKHHVSKVVLGNGVVHHSHETWLLRGITLCGKCGA